MSPVTRVGKSSLSIPAIHVRRDSILPAVDNWSPPPLVPEPMTVRGARKWIDAGMPDNTQDEYGGWR